MNRQRAQQTQQNAVPQQRNTLLRHVAVQPVADQELSFNESATGLEHDFSQLPARPATAQLGQPASNASCSVSPQRCPFGGACHSCPPHIQAKLKIGQPGDKYEQEADRVAEQVMRMPESQLQRKEGCSSCEGKEDEEDKLIQAKPLFGQITPLPSSVQRKTEQKAEKDEDEDKILQAKSTGRTWNAHAHSDHPLIRNALSSPGQPLDAATRSFMEPRFGQDFSEVRVHTDGQAAESARAVNARAYTVGRDVVFGAGQYTPGSSEGSSLIAHELTHTIQQVDQPNWYSQCLRSRDGMSLQKNQQLFQSQSVAPSLVMRKKEAAAEEISTRQVDNIDVDNINVSQEEPVSASLLESTDENAGAEEKTEQPAQKNTESVETEQQNKTESADSDSRVINSPDNTPEQLPESSLHGQTELSVTIDDSSSDALLYTLSTIPSSAMGSAMGKVRTATQQIQSREKQELQKSFPEIERPTGVPRLGEQKEVKLTKLEKGEAPTQQSEGRRENPPLEVRHEVAPAQNPSKNILTAASEPKAEEDGSWWEWLRSRIRRFVNDIPTYDPGLSTKTSRPKVDLTGDADPQKAARQQQSSDSEVNKRRTEADQAALADFGEKRVYPSESRAPRDILRPKYIPAPTVGMKGANVGVAPPLPADICTAIDQHSASSLQDRTNKFREEYGIEQEIYEQRSADARSDGQLRINQQIEATRQDQEDMQQEVREGVNNDRKAWFQENQEIQKKYNKESSSKRNELDIEIKNKVQATEAETDRKLTAAEQEADRERSKAEKLAAEEKRKAQNKPRSWWDRVKGAVSSAFKAIRATVNTIFDNLRELVKKIIETAKAAVRVIIEAARTIIVGLIKTFGEALKIIVTVALAGFPETAGRIRVWIDNKVNTAVEAVNVAAENLKEVMEAILDIIGQALDTALSIIQAGFNKILDIFESLVLGIIDLMELLHQLYIKFGAFLDGAKRIFENPQLILDALKAALGELIAQIPAEATSTVSSALSSSSAGQTFNEHLSGVWCHLKPKLDYLKDNWWEVLKQAGNELLWPWPGVWEDLKKVWDELDKIGTNIWSGDISKSIDKVLSIWRLINNILGRLYGWFFVAAVLIGTIIGAFFGGAGAIPGAAAGAAFAGKVGAVLLISTVAAETASIGKACFDLSEEEHIEENYEQIANSGLVLGIIGVMYLIGVIAARFARSIINRLAGRVWRRPALRGRGRTARGDVIETRVVMAAEVIGLLRRRAVTWLETIRRNFPVIDLLEGGQIRIIPRPRRAPLYQVNGGRLISVKSTGLVGADAQSAIQSWVDDLANFTSVQNVSVNNPTGRTLMVAVQNPLDDAAISALRAYANGQGVRVEMFTNLPPNHPALVFPDTIPTIMAEAGVVAGDEAKESQKKHTEKNGTFDSTLCN
jgi:hypothetical protein